MTRRLKVAVVGIGIGAQHVKAFAALPDLFALDTICDLNAEGARKLADEFGVPHVETDYGELLKRDIDVIDICTPSDLHFAHAMRALEAGRNVIVEKPLAGSLAEVDALAEAERKSGKLLSPIFQYRFGHGLAKLHHLKLLGLTGKPYVATIETHWNRDAVYYDNPWRGRWEGELGGCLITHAIHAHDILTEVLGPIARVYARTATRVNPIETEDCAALALDMANGALATLSVTLGSAQEISRLRFCFDGLTVESSLSPYRPQEEPWTFKAANDEGQARIDAALSSFAPGPEHYAGQFTGVYHAIVNAAPLPVTIASARGSLELITAAYASAATGRAETLPVPHSHPLYDGWSPARWKALN